MVENSNVFSCIDKIKELDKSKAYIFYLNVNRIPLESVTYVINSLKYACNEVGLNNVVFMPVKDITEPDISVEHIETLNKALKRIGYKVIKIKD